MGDSDGAGTNDKWYRTARGCDIEKPRFHPAEIHAGLEKPKRPYAGKPWQLRYVKQDFGHNEEW